MFINVAFHFFVFTFLLFLLLCFYSEYKEAFTYYDKNGDGTISEEELRNIMISFGQDPTADELQELMKEIDQDGTVHVNSYRSSTRCDTNKIM